MNAILNAVAFQIVWACSVGGAAQGWWWAGPLALLVFATWQLPRSHCWQADLRLMIFAALLGFLVDSLWIQAQWLQFTAPTPSTQWAPIWIVTLWMAFALTLNHSLRLFKQRLVLAALFGLLGGPLSYWIASWAWQAVSLPHDEGLALLSIGVAWALLTPGLLSLSNRWSSTEAGRSS